ncbi:GNAT family N-acetyltransferase [Mesorhizobium sp. LMG17149]|jgi:GNAT superfamily N-acetyltransferase|uniref:GNAT family N-acetyltransferase n=1 Tax=Mesorhizobium sp. LMG17149 TaxID=2968497 RepID=UPI000FE865E6|nr:GNAT family N-acetyltransferase [Mesorhizobium sp. LMG17149]MCQ8876252.1 GNAT family N-acetyltransferase [Mesorhizobium sp. LMG17149]RWO37490.1 MAG: GNAT family N-acetyltransferase [Mesorhizobium sp.]
MDILIRELVGLEEIAAIYPLYEQTGSMPEGLFRERLAAMIAQGNYRCVAAFIGERMVGMSGFWIGVQLWAGKWAEADHVVVDAQMRSAGIGAKLMAWIEEEAARVGCDITRISMVLGKERTHKFYSRNGYADDALILVKPLSAWAEAEFPEYAAHKVAMERG